jgi:putative ABC transport system permease protein
MAAWPMNLTGGPEPERVQAGIISPNFFSLLGVNPILGRTFAPEEEDPAKAQVMLLSRGYWKRRFGGDANVIGRVLQLNGDNVTIVGVVPDYVKFPDAVDVWRPLRLSAGARNSRGRSLVVVGRLKPGVSVEQAQADMDVVSSNTRAELPDMDAGWGVTVVPMNEQMVGDVRQALYVLLGAVAFVLLISAANVANLLLARATAREREVGIRIALGARRGRIIRQLLTESTLLSLVGGALGLLIAFWALSPLTSLLPKQVPRFTPIELNLQVLGFTFAIAVLTGIVFGLAPALRVSSASPQGALKEGGRSGAVGREHHRLRGGLVIAETATAMVLLICAGLLLQSFVRLLREPAGMQTDNVMTLQVSPASARYQKQTAYVDYFMEATRRVRTVPGVASAGAISWIPMDGLGSATGFTVDDAPKPKAGDEPVADVRAVTDDFFRTLGIQFYRGRDFDPSRDRADDKVKKVVINRSMADSFWPGQDPIGKRITMGWFEELHAEVVGVVADVRLVSLNKTARHTLYWYLPQFPNSFMAFMVRTSGDPHERLNDIRAQISSVDPQQPIGKMRTMDEIVGTTVSQPRFFMMLLAGFAGLALVLAAIGIYGVISYSVTQRMNELGVRLALGAQRRDILRLVIGGGMKLTAAGVALGVVAALGMTRLLTTLLFNTKPADPVAFLVVCVTVLLTALLATLIPARRAARLDPMNALRYE